MVTDFADRFMQKLFLENNVTNPTILLIIIQLNNIKTMSNKIFE